jgi:serine/threonine-protein kinase
MALTAGAQIGRYRIVDVLGKGGMATVYKALQTGLDRHVALKVLPAHLAGDPQFGERFQREAVMIANLRHPNILTIFDYGSDDGYTYIVSELVAGGTLSQQLGRPLTLSDALALLGPIAEALDHAHQRGIIHRDVKPSNILLADDGRPVLADFGIARMLDNSSGLTMAGRVVGTPAYMAPEQARGAPADSAVDRYALGIVAYEMLTGRVPFVADTTHAVLYAQVATPPAAPRELNPAISEAAEGALLRMLAKAPGDRFPTARAFIDALAAQQAAPQTGPQTVIAPPAAGDGRTLAGSWPERTAFGPSTVSTGQTPGAGSTLGGPGPLPPPPGTTRPQPLDQGPPTVLLDRRGRTRRVILLGIGGGVLVALGVVGGRTLLSRVRTRDRDDGPSTADGQTAPTRTAGPPPTRTPLAVIPPTTPSSRITDSAPLTPRPPTPPLTATAEARPPVVGPVTSPVALPPLTAWVRTGSPTGSWNINQAGVATARVTDGSSMLLTPSTFRDVEVFAEMSTPNREASLAVRIDANQNGYLGVYVPDGAPHLKGRAGGVAIVRVTGGTATPLAVARLPAMVQLRDTVRMRLLARDQQLTLFLNGREVARATDATYTQGRVGLRVFADADGPCDATFANVRVGAG